VRLPGGRRAIGHLSAPCSGFKKRQGPFGSKDRQIDAPRASYRQTFLRNALFTLGVYVLILRRALPPY